MKSKTLRVILLLAIAVYALTSCTAYKKIPYVENAETLKQSDLAGVALNYEAKVMPNDILLITVNTPTPEASKDFNLPLVPQTSRNISPTDINATTDNNGSLQNYIVDQDGYINFPILGKIKVGGLTKRQVEQAIHDKIYPGYTKENPIVTMRFLNYRVTVLGEVAKPGIYSSETAKMTLFDALASAGDLTIYGKRDRVLLIRMDEHGEKHIYPVNLQDKNLLLNNNLYNLQQNDVIYVEPNKTKGNDSQIGSLQNLVLSGLSLLVSITSLLLIKL